MNDAIRSAGAKLANIAYNLAQRDDIPADIIACLDVSRKEWDAAVRTPSAPVAREVPGWRLVPTEPTFEWKAQLVENGYKHSTIIADVLAAAPTPPRAPSTLAQQVASATAEMETWPDERRKNVKLAGGDQP